MTSHWKYTAAEKRAIDAAYTAVQASVEIVGWGSPARLIDATRYERKERSCMTVAKWLVVEGFVRGVVHNPPASDLASISAGIATAVILGAGTRGLTGAASVHAEAHILEAFKAGCAAHEAYMRRGIDGAVGAAVAAR
jgi:hypothetical protein